MFSSFPIHDNRHLHGLPPGATPDDVRARWELFAQLQTARLGGFAHRPGTKALERVYTTVHAYVSDNRWVADCPACNGGIGCWTGMDTGCCYDCGRIFDVKFPADWAEAEVVLRHRPPANRHWFPHRESVQDLKVENITRGFSLVGAVV